MTTTAEKLAHLNAYRVAEGKAPFADWRNARHQPMLEAYQAVSEFEASTEELATQEGRPSTEEVENDEPDALVITEDGEMVRESELTEEEAAKLPGAEDAVVTGSAKIPAYKDFANYDRSRIMKPVDFVHAFLDAHPDMARKAAVQALVEQGVNYSTARTQYQRWFAKRKG
ncbi:hypothetical protein [Aminobacter phage Erebus]|nr:hypothetical protein [Aminobacter phage Erebus]